MYQLGLCCSSQVLRKPYKNPVRQLSGRSAKHSSGLLQLIHFPQLCQHTSVLPALRPLNDHDLSVIKEQTVY